MQRESRLDSLRSSPTALNPILQLQQTVGNRRVAQLMQAQRLTARADIRDLAPKPAVAGDNYREEADRILLRKAGDSLQMNVGPQAFTHGSDIYFGAGSNPTNLEITAHELTHVIQQKGSPPLQTKKREEEVAPPGPESSIQRICAACTADDRKEKGFDPIDSQDVNAHAYTVGHNMVFGAGRLAPGTHEGRRLVAHELTHVVQESGADGTSVGQSNENRGLSPIPPTLHTQQNATRQTKLMVSTPGAPQLSPNAQAPAAPAGPGVAPGMATPGARPVDPPEVLNQLKTEAKADALKIKQLLHSNLKDAPMWEMGKLMLEGKKAAWDIIAKWGAKPREAGYQGRGGYMTPFDFFVAALQTQTFTVSEWGVDQWTNAFELICERLGGSNVAIFKMWVQTQGKLFKDEKPRGMVHFDVGQVLVEAGEVYLELGGAFLTGGSSLVAKIVKWLAVDLPKLMNQAKSVIDFVEKIRDVKFDDVKKFLSPTGIGRLLGSALFGKAGALPTVGEAQDEKKEREAGAPSEAGGLVALLRKVLTVVDVVKRSYSKVTEAVNAGLAKLDITKQEWFEAFSMVYAGIVHAVKTVKNPGAAMGKASETLRGIVGGFFQTIKEKIVDIASGIKTGLDLAGRGKKLIANLADKAVEMVVSFLIKHNPSAAIKAALRVLETAADQPIVQLLRNKVPYGDEIFKKISESSIVRGLLSPLERPVAAVSEMTETAAGEATAVVTKVEQEALALVGDGATMVSELAGVPVPQGDASAPGADVAGASGKAAGGGKASPGFLGALKQGIHAGLLELGTLNMVRHGKQLGKAVVQVGLPKDPNERLAKGMTAGVAAINEVKGDKVPGTVAKAKLFGLRLRYGLPVLEPIAKNGRWYVHGEIQRAERATDKSVAAGEIDVPSDIKTPASISEPTVILENELPAIYFHSDQTRLLTVYNGRLYYVSSGKSTSDIPGQPAQKVKGEFYEFRGILERDFEYTIKTGEHKKREIGWLIKGPELTELGHVPELKNFTYRSEGDFTLAQVQNVNRWLKNHGAEPLDFHTWVSEYMKGRKT